MSLKENLKKINREDYIFLAFLLLVLLFGFASNLFYPPDNKYEEFSEEVIEQNTGIKIDLTPNSKES